MHENHLYTVWYDYDYETLNQDLLKFNRIELFQKNWLRSFGVPQ
jgi:hypothetical protein